MCSLHLDSVTCDKLIDPWMDSCSPTGHTLNRSTWETLAARSEDGSFPCPFSRTVLTIDSLQKNILAANLIAQIDKDEEIKTIIHSSNPLGELVQEMRSMHQDMLKRDAEAKAMHLHLIKKVDTLTQIVWVSHKQTENLSQIGWGDTFLMTLVPHTRKERLKAIKNKGISPDYIQLIDKFVEKHSEVRKK
ncbi:hypothetical protein PHSC3_000389 [Chlamydiales bacterium STE3]|nr:hypothetical protein PHSC3_000389 [Chlamydiales bacterium STE3]